MTFPDDDNTRTHIVLTEGMMVSHYRIVEKIVAGGMGEVYLNILFFFQINRIASPAVLSPKMAVRYEILPRTGAIRLPSSVGTSPTVEGFLFWVCSVE